MSSAPTIDRGEVTDDAFLGGRLLLLQPKRGHRSGSDAVLLAAAVPATRGDRVLEAGAGVGVAAYCIAARVPDLRLTLVEQDEALCALARANALANAIEADVVTGDVTQPGACERPGLLREGYDHVLANPPFYASGSTRTEVARREAHVMPERGLDAWLRFLASACRPGGTLTLIHRPEALPALLPALEGRFGATSLFPLFPRAGEPAERILIRAVKGSRDRLSLKPGLVLHEATGAYTPTAESILRHAQALTM